MDAVKLQGKSEPHLRKPELSSSTRMVVVSGFACASLSEEPRSRVRAGRLDKAALAAFFFACGPCS